jgi:transposase
MGKPYSDDLRERVIAAIEAGHTREEVAELSNMALSPVGGFIKRERETGSVSPDKFGGYKTFSLEPHADLVKDGGRGWLGLSPCHPGRDGDRDPNI